MFCLFVLSGNRSIGRSTWELAITQHKAFQQGIYPVPREEVSVGASAGFLNAMLLKSVGVRQHGFEPQLRYLISI